MHSPSPDKGGAGGAGPMGKSNSKALQLYSKLKATLLRFVPLAHMWDDLSSDEEREIFISALSHDMQLKLCHVRYFIEGCPLMTTFIVRKLYATVNKTDAMSLINMLPHPSLQKAVRAVTANAYFANFSNPTGRYSLNLDNPTDRDVADTLFSAAAWEKSLAVKFELVDTSQYGDNSCLRNLVYAGTPMRDNQFNLNTTPGGKLDFDYCTRIYKAGGTLSYGIIEGSTK